MANNGEKLAGKKPGENQEKSVQRVGIDRTDQWQSHYTQDDYQPLNPNPRGFSYRLPSVGGFCRHLPARGIRVLEEDANQITGYKESLPPHFTDRLNNWVQSSALLFAVVTAA